MPIQTVGIYRTGANSIPSVVVDVVLTEQHTADNVVTSNPVEQGSPISDHVIVQPDVVEISAEVSNYDGNESQSLGERAKTAWQQLKKLRNDRNLLRITTHHETYENMAIVSIGAEHVPGFTGRVRLTAKFQKVDVTNFSGAQIDPFLIKGFPDGENVILSPEERANNISRSVVDTANWGNRESLTAETDPSLMDIITQKLLDRQFNVNIDAIIYTEIFDGIRGAIELLPLPPGITNFVTTFTLGKARQYLFRTRYSHQSKSWSVDIFDSNGLDIASGKSIAPGTNLLEGLPDLQREIGSLVAINNKNVAIQNESFIGDDENSDILLANFSPGVYEGLQETVDSSRIRPLNFTLEEQGYVVG